MFIKPVLILLALSAGVVGFTQTYVGAEGALKAIKGPAPVAPLKPDPEADFRRKVAEYRKSSLKLSKHESAQAWLDLVDQVAPQQAFIESYVEPNTALTGAMSALPAPDVWPEIEKLLQTRLATRTPSRRDSALLVLIATLEGERAKAWDSLVDQVGHTNEQQVLIAQSLTALSDLDRKPDHIDSAYRRLALTMSQPTEPFGSEKVMELPDLEALIGNKQARALLGDLLQTFDGEFFTNGSKSFQILARETTLATLGKLKHPQWVFAEGIGCGPLFAALHKRFPDVQRGVQGHSHYANDSYSDAATYYTVYLVANGQTDDAIAFAKGQEESWSYSAGLGDDEMTFLRQRGKLGEFARFRRELAKSDKDGDLIDDYVRFCDEAGLQEQASAYLASLPKPKLALVRDAMDREVRLLVKAGKVKEAAEILRTFLLTSPKPKTNDRAIHDASVDLYVISVSLQRPALRDLAIASSKRQLRFDDDTFMEKWVLRALVKANRGPEAERLLADLIQKKLREQPPNIEEVYVDLLELYAESGRYADVVTLLDDVADWGVSDVAFLDGSRSVENEVPLIAAKALAKVGRNAEALRVVEFLLQSGPALDEAFELLLELDPGGAAARLDIMHRISPTSTRPLMWKAELMRRHGRLADADTTIRSALALDPQDTQARETHTRFQAWEILARIEGDEGRSGPAKLHHAKFDHRGNEFTDDRSDWDNFDVNGLARRLKELDSTPDDFRLRFYVADDFERAGKREEAKAQVLRACQDLVSEFGPASRVDCEDDQPDIAATCEKYLLHEIELNPSHLAAYDVLGDLYVSTERYEKARDCFEKAVSISPDNLFAWESLNSVSEHVMLPQPLREIILLNMIRLNPLGQINPEYAVANYAELWSTSNASLENVPRVEEPIYELNASKLAGANNEDQNLQWTRERDWPPTPGSIVARDKTIKSLLQLVGALPPRVSKPGAED